MKTAALSLIIILMTVSWAAAEDSLSWVDQQIAAIKPKRSGISDAKIAELASPIRYTKIEEDPEAKTPGGTKPAMANIKLPEPVRPLKVTAILNKSALIDGQWLKVNSSVRGYKVRRINGDNVVLQSSNKKLKLFIKEKNDHIKIQIN
ncbi:MAG: hypothetical protein DSZ03_03215 [Sulfurimonas sp.]|nr:MAG: hypothetical protein DSZ03_03215 [Sulfurimonas sp.]